jgi:hypothetical protein
VGEVFQTALKVYFESGKGTGGGGKGGDNEEKKAPEGCCVIL